jgi:periodic tryptophan protein 1
VSNNTPQLVCAQDLNTGAVFSASFCGDAPHLLAAGGAGGEVVVWDVRAHAAVAAKFPAFAATLPTGPPAAVDDD